MTQAEILAGVPLTSLFIGGEWTPSGAAGRLDVICPIDGRVIAQAADANGDDAARAVAAAREAFDTGVWPRLSFAERTAWVRRLTDSILARCDALAELWTLQVGVPPARAAMLRQTLGGVIASYLEIGDSFAQEVQRPTKNGFTGLQRYEPVGVVAAIAPWNVPATTMLNKVIPALLAGCTVIMKPAPETPIEAYIFAQCAQEIGLPPGVLNLISAGFGGSDALVRHEGVDKVSFTGSVATGKHIAAICAQRVARCTLELGGKSAAIVLEDYDPRDAAHSLIGGIVSLSGQNCSALTRVLVKRSEHDALVDALCKEAAKVQLGQDGPVASTLGPIASQRQLDHVRKLVAAGVAEGARVAFSSRQAAAMEAGFYHDLTIFADVHTAMTIAQEEVFGPVLVVMPYDDVVDAIRIANDSKYGLCGAVFTHDDGLAREVMRGVRTGTIVHNDAPRIDFDIGFGGFKQSGIGREGGIQGLKGFLESKTMLLGQ